MPDNHLKHIKAMMQENKQRAATPISTDLRSLLLLAIILTALGFLALALTGPT